jgi:hypothetical protein
VPIKSTKMKSEITVKSDAIKCRTFTAAIFGGKDYFYMLDDGLFLRFQESGNYPYIHSDMDWRNREYAECSADEFRKALSFSIGRQAASIQHLQSVMSGSCELFNILHDVPRFQKKHVGVLEQFGYKDIISPEDVVVATIEL